MKKINYIFYKDFITKNKRIEKGILISKIKHSYMLGPIINRYFDECSFIKRLTSSSIYTIKNYKNFNKRYAIKIINKYYAYLDNNEVLEITNKSELIKHKIIKVPGDEK